LACIAALRGMYVGYKSGFFPELLRIVAYIATAIAAFHFYEPVAEFITLKTFLNSSTATVAAFIGVALGTFLIARLVILIILKLLKVGSGGAVNRILGTLLGVCRWGVILSVAFMLINELPGTTLKHDINQRSLAGPPISKIAPTLFDFMSSLSPQLAVKSKKL